MTSMAGTGFEDVDRTSDPLARVSYLDAVAALRETVAHKRRTFELMHLHAGDTVLDVGCGAGDDLRSLAELVGPSAMSSGSIRAKRWLP